MSGALAAFGQIGLIGAEALTDNLNIGNLETAFFKPLRRVGLIFPDCVIQEQHSDRLQITQHPVEVGANTSDHAFLLPFEVSIRIGFTDSIVPSTIAGLVTGQFHVPGAYLQRYQELQQMMARREPFSIITGKRNYSNMLITDMEVTTDQHTEHVLMVELHCQQVIITTTSSVPATPAQDQTLAPQTSQSVSSGPVNLSPAGNPSITGYT